MDRNEYIQAGTGVLNLSLSARRAWIEILLCYLLCLLKKVALRKESVDRNFVSAFDVLAVSAVALRKESVDRNISLIPLITLLIMSLSARRAWIEISR